jgi:hypothetical protein
MPRTLSAARVRVPAQHEAEWLAVAARLAGLLKARGQHLWVFRAESDPGLWLEFSESGDRPAHRAVAVPTPEIAALERRLRELAIYEADASALWTEVPLPKEP